MAERQADRRRRPMPVRSTLLRVAHPAPVEVIDDGSSSISSSRGTTPRRTCVVADILELYVRFRAKEDVMPRKGWLELLEVTMPKLEVGGAGVAWDYRAGVLRCTVI